MENVSSVDSGVNTNSNNSPAMRRDNINSSNANSNTGGAPSDGISDFSFASTQNLIGGVTARPENGSSSTSSNDDDNERKRLVLESFRGNMAWRWHFR